MGGPFACLPAARPYRQEFVGVFSVTDVSIHPDLLLSILFGAPNGQRFTQDTPVLPEVWVHYAKSPGQPARGLIVPRKSQQAHNVADELYARLRDYRSVRKLDDRGALGVSDMPGLVTLNAYFDEVVNVVLPLTQWWKSGGMADLVELPEATLREWVGKAVKDLQYQAAHPGGRLSYELETGHLGKIFRQKAAPSGTAPRSGRGRLVTESTARLIVVLGALNAAQKGYLKPAAGDGHLRWVRDIGELDADAVERGLGDVLQVRFLRRRLTPLSPHYVRLRDQEARRRDIEATKEATKKDQKGRGFDPRLIFSLGMNRMGGTAVRSSVKTVKADAARRLFELSNGSVTWAVIDSGIDAKHYAFRKYGPKETPTDEQVEAMICGDDPVPRNKSRVVARYDMTLINDIRDRDTLSDDTRRAELANRIMHSIDLPTDSGNDPTADDVLTLLDQAAEDLRQNRPLDWDLAERIMQVRHDRTPGNHHGTHVAGTLGGYWPEQDGDQTTWISGMCPDIRLIDFNVIGGSMQATEFAIVAALRLIRHLNERSDYVVVHGANLSLSIPHDVTNYACGRTPVCEECESVVNNGVVVVAAAGNMGYNTFWTKAGDVPLHTDTSITDPGNAEAVITVGATHRRAPHTYGVSYFSSRGPTGDGRMKPDLVAPGEKIDAPICDNEFATLEGTSMAAPHVSGAAAMLMSRFPELIGNPKRIKDILCATATDLGRERAYQGHGLVDILRALQSV